MVKEAYEAPAAVMTKHQQKKVQKDAKQRFKSGAVLLGAMWKSHPTSRIVLVHFPIETAIPRFAHLSSDRIEEDVTDAALEKSPGLPKDLFDCLFTMFHPLNAEFRLISALPRPRLV